MRRIGRIPIDSGIDPGEQTVFAYRPGEEIEVFDEPDAVLPMASFASELRLTVEELFSWLS